MLLQVAILVGEVVGGYLTHSLALLSDAGHVFTDVLALVISLWAVRLAARPASGRHTFGFRRAEILAALFNGLSLVVVSVFIFAEAYQRWSNPHPIEVKIMLVIAVAGLLGNLGGVLWLVKAQRTANIRSALLHLVSDAVSSVAVVIGGLAMLWGGPAIIDTLVSIFVGLLIVVSALRLVLDVLDVLLETAPTGMATETVIAALADVQGVLEVHEFHLWRITHELPALSAHILVDPAADRDQVLQDLQSVLASRFAIRHTTLQLEIDRLVRIGTRVRA